MHELTRAKVHHGLIAAALVGPFLGGCAQSTGSPVGADTAVIFDQLLARIYGSADDRRDADRLMHERMQLAIADCMREEGQDYSPAPYQGVAGGPMVPADVTFAAPLGADFGIAAGKQTVAEGFAAATNPGFEDLTDEAERQAYLSALERCADAGAAFQESYRPAGQDALSAPFEELLLEAQASEEVQGATEDYQACLAQRDVQAASWLDLWSAAHAQFPTVELPWEELSMRADWADAVAFEQALAEADAACRGSLRDAGLAATADDVTAFADDHADALLTLDAQWADLRAAAAAAGVSD